MVDLAFYNAGCSGKTGLRKLAVPPRRLLRRILRPFLQRQVELFQSVLDRLDALDRLDGRHAARVETLHMRHAGQARQLEDTQALAWDYQDLMPRLALLEDRIEALMVESEQEQESESEPEQDGSESVRFPTVAADPARARAS